MIPGCVRPAEKALLAHHWPQWGGLTLDQPQGVSGHFRQESWSLVLDGLRRPTGRPSICLSPVFFLCPLPCTCQPSISSTACCSWSSAWPHFRHEKQQEKTSTASFIRETERWVGVPRLGPSAWFKPLKQQHRQPALTSITHQRFRTTTARLGQLRTAVSMETTSGIKRSVPKGKTWEQTKSNTGWK